MRVLVSRLMPVLETPFRARAAALGVLAGLVALAAIVLLYGSSEPQGQAAPAEANASRLEADPGGETVVAKLARAVAKPLTLPGLNRKPAVTAGPEPTLAPTRDEEPNLAGLSEIPRELLNRPASSGDKPKPRGFAAFSKGGGPVLPWDAVEPVPFAPLAPAAGTAQAAEQSSGQSAPVAALQPLDLPDGGDVGAWIKTKVTEIKGADRQRPLYHFELWLEPPAEMKRRLVGVAYDFNSPAVMPQSQASSDQASGFRISAGGLACADKITVVLRFDDGRSKTVALDGCKILG